MPLTVQTHSNSRKFTSLPHQSKLALTLLQKLLVRACKASTKHRTPDFLACRNRWTVGFEDVRCLRRLRLQLIAEGDRDGISAILCLSRSPAHNKQYTLQQAIQNSLAPPVTVTTVQGPIDASWRRYFPTTTFLLLIRLVPLFMALLVSSSRLTNITKAQGAHDLPIHGPPSRSGQCHPRRPGCEASRTAASLPSGRTPKSNRFVSERAGHSSPALGHLIQ